MNCTIFFYKLIEPADEFAVRVHPLMNPSSGGLLLWQKPVLLFRYCRGRLSFPPHFLPCNCFLLCFLCPIDYWNGRPRIDPRVVLAGRSLSCKRLQHKTSSFGMDTLPEEIGLHILSFLTHKGNCDFILLVSALAHHFLYIEVVSSAVVSQRWRQLSADNHGTSLHVPHHRGARIKH